MTEDEMVGWHHQLNGHEFEQTLGMEKDSKTWHTAVHGVSQSNMTEQLNNSNQFLGLESWNGN